MSRYHSYLNSAIQVLESYTGEEPFANALKKFFATDKKFGSRDRKQISQYCYSYFRLGYAIRDKPIDDRIVIAYAACIEVPDELFKEIGHPGRVFFPVTDIFPWKDQLSKGIDYTAFCQSFLLQPDLFIRLRPGKQQKSLNKLTAASITFTAITTSCIALPNTSKIETILELNKEAVIQDRSSQQIADFFPDNINTAWDCCAGSGGKSIMLYDLYPDIDLTVTDIRESILINLKKRFFEAGIANYKSFVADLQRPTFSIQPGSFDLIVADVPCTGSGTWGRTPEQLFYFTTNKISEYTSRQQKIISHIIPALKPGGYLLYITCSVFTKENEGIVEYIQQNSKLEVVKQEVLTGYDKKADTMFAALLRKPL